MKTRSRRVLIGTLFTMVALVTGLAIAAWLKFGDTLPPSEGAIRLAGLDGPVEITADSMGIAQVWAETEHDALFGLGWLHAADRMFNIDFLRRVSQGRLSAMLGPTTVEFDMERRRDGHVATSRNALDRLSPANRTRLQAYTDGVNACAQSGVEPPLEFILLQKPFEEWRVFDCLTLLNFMTWYSDALQNRDGFFASLAHAGHADAVRALPIEYPAWAPTTVRAARTERRPASGSLREQAACLLAQSVLESGASSFTPARSSNAWAVAPSRSASGQALFCSDPHLEIARLPQFWYAVGLHVRQTGLDVIGITIPGLPFIVMGHNGRAAWAFTAGGVDVVDYYIERRNPTDSTQYLERIDPARGADSLVWRTMEIIRDTIEIALEDTIASFTILRTHHGPARAEWSGPDSLYVIRWAGQDNDLDAATTSGFNLMRIADFESFRASVASMGALNANWMYADRDGNIGYQLGTPVPVRGDASPYLPLDGWVPENDWDGYLPPDQAPWSLNPPEGWLANCNNKAADSPNIPGSFAADRILRISDLLQSQELFSVADMQEFQLDRTDVYRLRWRSLVDAAGALLTDTTGSLAAVRAWDGSTDTASLAISLVVVFLDELKKEVFGDELPAHANEIGRLTLDEVMFGGDSVWVDDVTTASRVESRLEIARRALERSLHMIGGRKWGQVQTFTMAHPMAGVPLVGRFVDLSFGPWSWPGSPGSLNASFHERTGAASFRTIVGPSWRFVVDFADVDGATMVLPAGNSGNPLSPHFFDFFEMWRNGERWNVPLSRERVYARAVSILTLEPDESAKVGQ